jgi:predicted phosphoadenosine phosphosulfate sulfurtransferase
MSKIYLTKNVYEAALERLAYIGTQVDRVVVAFSGGKDSTVLLHLAMEVFPHLDVYFWDKESNLISTKDFVLQTMDSLPDGVAPYWFCLKYKMRNALSILQPYWYAWDEEECDRWIYQPPERPYVYTAENNILHGHDPERHNLYKLFGEYVSDNGRVRTAVLVGLRTDESLNRFRAVTKHPQLGKNWISPTEVDNVYNAYPIYDWDWADIWTYVARNEIQYAPVYDRMYQAGVLKRSSRISQAFCDVSKKGIPIIREIEPESFARFINRVAGVNSLAHVDLGEVLKLAKKVDFDFLLQLYPEKTRRQIERRVDRMVSLDKDDENMVRALLNNDIRFKRVNRPNKTDLKEKYGDL